MARSLSLHLHGSIDTARGQILCHCCYDSMYKSVDWARFWHFGIDDNRRSMSVVRDALVCFSLRSDRKDETLTPSLPCLCFFLLPVQPNHCCGAASTGYRCLPCICSCQSVPLLLVALLQVEAHSAAAFANFAFACRSCSCGPADAGRLLSTGSCICRCCSYTVFTTVAAALLCLPLASAANNMIALTA